MKKKTIFIYATDGFNDRFIMKSDIINRLAKQIDQVIIFYHDAENPLYKKLFENDRVHVFKAEDEKYKEYIGNRKLYRILIQLRAYIHNGKYNTYIVDWFRKIFIAQNKWTKEYGFLAAFKGKLWEAVSQLFKNSLILRKSLILIESKLFVIKPHKKYFIEYKPDLVIVSALSSITYNENFAREAKSFGVEVCSIMGSWDYAVGLGNPGFSPDYISAWNQDMKNDLVTLNDIPEKKITINGIPYWDSRYNKKEIIDKEEFYKFFGLDPAKKIILNATHPPKRFPWGPEFISNLVDAINENKVHHDCQIIIRIHPTHFHEKGDFGLNQKIIDKYNNLENDNRIVILNAPNTKGNRDDYSFGDEENIMMNSLLKYSDVMVTMFSTMQIEAALFDLPVVNYGIREIADADYQKTRLDPESLLKMPHISRVMQTNGVRTATTFDQLYSHINDYLDNPTLDVEGRKKIEENFVGDFKGSGSKATANYIHTILNL
jgi:hypothetical protein